MSDDLDRAPCGLATLARGGRFIRVNSTLCGWLGYSRDELREKRFQDVLTIGSRLFHQTHWEPLLQMQGSVAEVQLEMAARDGRGVPILVNAVRRERESPQHETELAVFVATDRRKYERELLLAKRRAEELTAMVQLRENEFRMVAENSPDVIARFDRSAHCVYLSPAADEFLSEPRLGAHVEDSPLLAPLAAGLKEVFTGQETTSAFVFSRKNGDQRELEARVVPERDGTGAIVSALAIIRDVTSLRVHEREAEQRAIVAEQLIGIVSHDLRNPLNAVLFGTHLLSTKELGSEQRIVQRIASAAQRANRLVGDLLDFTRARLTGGLLADPQPIDLHAVVADSLEELRAAWPGRLLVHETDGAGKGSADPDRVAQVLGNLVSNALVYGSRDRPVTVSSSVSSEALELRVHNDGPTIPESLKPHIFEPLRRGVDKGSDRSIGLGLYIVREIAAAHGGTVEARSFEGEGTTFVVRFPQTQGATT